MIKEGRASIMKISKIMKKEQNMFQDTVSLLSRRREQAHRARRSEEMMEIITAMISGFTIALAVINCCTKMKNKQSRVDLKRKSSETIDAVMDTVENFRDKAECVKEDIKSGFKDFKNGARESADEISNSFDDSTE